MRVYVKPDVANLGVKLRMIVIRKRIFGKCFELILPTDYEFEAEGRKSIQHYQDDHFGQVQVALRFQAPPFSSPRSANPKIFVETEDYIVWDFPKTLRLTVLKQSGIPATTPLTVFVELGNLNLSPLVIAKSIFAMEFPSRFDQIIQILHELVLVPVTFLDPGIAPVHGSAISINGEVAIFSGTGGVGKSSAMLIAAKLKDERISFMADDMALLSNEGLVNGNFAWPKVYGYNLNSLPDKVDLLRGRNFADKLHFFAKIRLANGDKVRRKVSPLALFPSIQDQGRLSSLTFMFRANTTKFKIEKVDVERAAHLSLAIMEGEYGDIYKYLAWTEYNQLINRTRPVLTLAEMRKNWLQCYRSGLSRSRVQIVHIPLNATAADLEPLIKAEITRLGNV